MTVFVNFASCNIFFKNSFYYLNILINLSTSLSFTMALFWIFFALDAYLKVLKVSYELSSAGDMAHIIAVREFPPNAFLKMNVNFESL